jgi:hypothetical protein
LYRVRKLRAVSWLSSTRAPMPLQTMGVSARSQKISPERQYAMVLLYYFLRTRPEILNLDHAFLELKRKDKAPKNQMGSNRKSEDSPKKRTPVLQIVRTPG